MCGRLEKSYDYNIRTRLIHQHSGLIWQQREGLVQENHYNRCREVNFILHRWREVIQHFTWLECTLKLLRWPRTNLWQHLEITIFEDQEASEIYDTFRLRPFKSWVKGGQVVLNKQRRLRNVPPMNMKQLQMEISWKVEGFVIGPHPPGPHMGILMKCFIKFTCYLSTLYSGNFILCTRLNKK